MSASKRRKAGRATFAARVEMLRTIKIVVAHSGREIRPGTVEYEKELLRLAKNLSKDEFEGLTGEMSNVKNAKDP